MQKASLTLPQALRRLKKADDSVRDAIGEDIERAALLGQQLASTLRARPTSGYGTAAPGARQLPGRGRVERSCRRRGAAAGTTPAARS